MADIFIRKNMSKIKEIPALREITKLHNVSDFAKLANFVFTTIPHGADSGIDIEQPVDQLYWQFINKEKFGWCYMHALYYHLLLKEYGHDSYVYDYGLSEPQLTHSVVIVTLRDHRYLIDPYFNRHYVNENGGPMPFPELLKRINNNIDKIYSDYGSGLKEVRTREGFKPTTPQDFEAGVINSWKVKQDYDKVMMKEFNNTNALLLMSRKIQKAVVRKKVDGTKYFDFF